MTPFYFYYTIKNMENQFLVQFVKKFANAIFWAATAANAGYRIQKDQLLCRELVLALAIIFLT